MRRTAVGLPGGQNGAQDTPPVHGESGYHVKHDHENVDRQDAFQKRTRSRRQRLHGLKGCKNRQGNLPPVSLASGEEQGTLIIEREILHAEPTG